MKKIARVWGPYLTTRSGISRRLVVLCYEDGTRKTTAYARYLLEQSLGRELAEGEEADHIDEDTLNDAIDNLRPLPAEQNRKRSAKSGEMYYFDCPVCETPAAKPLHRVKYNNFKQGKAGPFCSKTCARRHQLQGSLAE